MADYQIADIYQGGYSSLSPTYGPVFTGYRVGVSQLGLSTDPRTANIIKEVSDKIAPGEKIIELSLISPEVVEAIPKQHLDEVRRMSKLTGVEVTVHGPLVDASGVSQEGFTEQQREVAERKIFNAIERSHQINPEGNIPVTFHTANQLPGVKYRKTENGEEVETMPVVNQETGKLAIINLKQRNFPGEEKVNITRELDKINEDQWRQSLSHLAYNTERAQQLIEEYGKGALAFEAEKKAGKEISGDQKRFQTGMNIGTAFLNDSYRELKSLYEIAYKHGDENSKKALIDLNKKIEAKAKKISKSPDSMESIALRREIVEDSINILNHIPTPQLYKPAEEFAIEKSVDTFGNAAWNSYKKFGENAPIISIENPPAGFGLSRSEDLKNIVEKSREKFVDNAVKNGMPKGDAEKEAEKLIGVTWDVGHINQLRQFGFSGKDIVGEAGKIAHLVKHVHLSDNFGMENTELPMGMGNVDFKEVMEKLGKKGEDARKIVEAAHWWIHQQNSPIGVSMEALGSPIYGMKMAPYWNQAQGFHQGYFGGYGAFLPQINYETFGSGFSQLPNELGGQRQQTGKSRMSGNPME